MTPKTKGELLEHYSNRQPNYFIQLDCFTEGFDGIVEPDEDGHALFRTETYELMGGSNVRILIEPRTSPADAAAILRKWASQLDESEPFPGPGDIPF